MSRLSRALLLAVFALVVAAPSAAAVPQRDLNSVLLADLWETVLETPTAENPFTGGDPCVDLGAVVAPIGPNLESFECTVKPSQKIFAAAWSSECSTFEEGSPFFGGDEAELRACARTVDAGLAVTLTVDGTPMPLSEVESDLLRIHLPEDNIFGASDRKGLSVAHGWVSYLGRLSPGTHEIVVHVVGIDAFGIPIDFTNTTTIIVTKR